MHEHAGALTFERATAHNYLPITLIKRFYTRRNNLFDIAGAVGGSDPAQGVRAQTRDIRYE